MPTLAIDSRDLQDEGNSGTVNATFTVTLSEASSQTVTVAYATANGTATAGSDYTATAGTLTFAPGTLTQPVLVPVAGDTLYEPDETFTVTLASPTGASDARGPRAHGTIPTTIRTDACQFNASVTEGQRDGGCPLAVTLSAASRQTVTVTYATANGTATAGSDYTSTSGTLTFTPGRDEPADQRADPGDTVIEGNETFTVTLSGAANATIGQRAPTGTTIQDDDVAGRCLEFGDLQCQRGRGGALSR